MMHEQALPERNIHTGEGPVFPPAARSLAQVISYITHPLFIPTLVTFLIIQSIPEYMVAFKPMSKKFAFDILYFRVVAITVFFPLLTVLLGKQLGFVSSVYMKTQRERIIPYVAIIIYYFWAFYTFLQEGRAPRFYTAFFLGSFLAVSISFITNSFMKTSLHSIGWGGVIGFLLALMWGMHMNVSFPLVITFLVAGVVATARMVLNAHQPFEIYTGLFIGIITQLAACWFLVI